MSIDTCELYLMYLQANNSNLLFSLYIYFKEVQYNFGSCAYFLSNHSSLHNPVF